MKMTLVTLLFLTGCGGQGMTTQPDLTAPSSRPAVPCSQSAECMAVGSKAKTCAESLMGTPAIMMSTWDNGKTWLKGNCDATAPFNA